MRIILLLLFSFFMLSSKADNAKNVNFYHNKPTEMLLAGYSQIIIENNFLNQKIVAFDTICLGQNTPTSIDFFITEEIDSTETDLLKDSTPLTKKVKFRRGKAILFTIFTGFLGGHRIYFGTHQRTPIIYSITLGGLGLLPLIDLIHIIFTKDLSKFENIPQIIMWGR